MNECRTLRDKVLVARQWNEAGGNLLQTHQIGLVMFTKNERSNHLQVGEMRGNAGICSQCFPLFWPGEKLSTMNTMDEHGRFSSGAKGLQPNHTSGWSDSWGCAAVPWKWLPICHSMAWKPQGGPRSCNGESTLGRILPKVLQTGSQSTRSYKCPSVLVSFAAAHPRIGIPHTWLGLNTSI